MYYVNSVGDLLAYLLIPFCCGLIFLLFFPYFTIIMFSRDYKADAI